MIIGIGSINPAKISAVEEAVAHAHGIRNIADDIQFQSMEVASGVSAQPFSDEETRQGAFNRAMAVLYADSGIDRAFGLEGGVVKLGDGLYSTVWVVVLDRKDRSGASNGIRFRLPDSIASGILAGKEMGDVIDELCRTKNMKHREGMIGVVTAGVVTRSQAYGELARIAYGLFLSDFNN